MSNQMRIPANAEKPLVLLLDPLRLLIRDASLAGSTCSGSYSRQNRGWLRVRCVESEGKGSNSLHIEAV